MNLFALHLATELWRPEHIGYTDITLIYTTWNSFFSKQINLEE